jgi:hypothetical protein
VKVKVTLTVTTEWCSEDLGEPERGDPLEGRILDSVAEAIANAIHYAEGEGHKHDLEDVIAITLCDDPQAERLDPTEPPPQEGYGILDNTLPKGRQLLLYNHANQYLIFYSRLTADIWIMNKKEPGRFSVVPLTLTLTYP